MNPEEVRQEQELWDAYAEAFGVREAIARFGPRPRMPDTAMAQVRQRRPVGETIGEVLQQGLGGIAETALGVGEGVTGLAGLLLPGEDGFERLSGRFDEAQKSIPEPRTGLGRTTRGVSRIGSEIASALLPGAALGKAGKLGALGRVGVDALADATIEAGVDPEESLAGALGLEKTSESLAGRALVGGLTSGLFALPFEGSRAVRSARNARQAALDEAAEQASRIRVSDLPPGRGAADSDVILPGQTAREVELAEEAKGIGMIDPKRRGPIAPEEGFPRPAELAPKIKDQAREIARLDGALAGEVPGTTAYNRLVTQLEDAEEAYVTTLADYTGGVSDAARTMAQHRFLVEAEKTVPALHAFVTRKLGGNITRGQLSELDQFIKKGPAGEVESVDAIGVAKWIEQQKSPMSWGDWSFYTTFIRAGMLSAPYSPLRSLFGNTTSAAIGATSAPLRSASDQFLEHIIRRWSGKEDIGRTFVLSSKSLERALSAQGISRDWAASLNVVKQGFDELDLLDRAQTLRKLELGGRPLESGLTLRGKDVVHEAAQQPFRWQGAADIPFRRMVSRASIAQQAVEIATRVERLGGDDAVRVLVREGLDEDAAKQLATKAADQRIVALLERPTIGMEARALEEAEFFAFQSNTLISKIINAAKSMANESGPARALADLFFPFVRTPSAIAARTIEASPIGALHDAVDLFKLHRLARGVKEGAKRGEDRGVTQIRQVQNKLARRMGEQALFAPVWLAFLLGRDLALEEHVTGPLPRDAQEREQFFREGKVPYGVNFMGRWWSLAQMPPLGHVVAMGADLGRYERENEEALRRGEDVTPFSLVNPLSWVEPGARTAKVGVDIVKETPFAQGVARLSDLLNEGGGVASRTRSAVANTFASVVPNVAAAVARADDPIRQKRRDEMLPTIRDTFVEKLPYISRELPPRVDPVTGQVLTREETTAGRLGSLVDPFGSSPDRKSDPIIEEFAETGTTPSAARKLTTEDNFDFAERMANEGPAVRLALMAFIGAEGTNEGYQMLTRAGVSQDLQREYMRLKELPPSQEVREAQQEILKDVISRVRRSQTENRNREARRRELADLLSGAR